MLMPHRVLQIAASLLGHADVRSVPLESSGLESFRGLINDAMEADLLLRSAALRQSPPRSTNRTRAGAKVKRHSHNSLRHFAMKSGLGHQESARRRQQNFETHGWIST